MPNWPNIDAPSQGYDGELYLPQVKQEFTANYIQTRKIATRARSRWALTWKLMTEADYLLLAAFFVANQGSSFTWVHPRLGTSHTCVFSGDSIKYKEISGVYRTDVQCPIEEL